MSLYQEPKPNPGIVSYLPYSSCRQTLTAESSEPLRWGSRVPGFGTTCCVQLDQQGKRNHRFFLKQFTQAATFFKSPSLSSYKCFSPLQPQPRPHQSPQVTSPHQAGLLSQSGIKGEPSTKYGLVYCLAQISVRLARESGMASHNSPFYILLKQAPWVKIEV